MCVSALVLCVGAVSFLSIRYPDKYSQAIIDECDKYGLDTSLVKGVIWTESKFRKDALSGAGAMGLMQLLPSTADWCAQKLNMDSPNLFDAKTNIALGTYYLNYLINKFDNIVNAVAAYNAGEGNVLKWIAAGVEPQFEETREYINRVLRTKKIYEFKQR